MRVCVRLLSLLLFLTGLNACLPTRQLQPGQALLYEQSVKGNKELDVEGFEELYRQKPNRKILYLPIMPYLSAYFIGQKLHEKNFPKDSLRMLGKIEELEEQSTQLTQYIDSLKSLSEEQLPESYAKDSTKLAKQNRRTSKKLAKKQEQLKDKIENGNWIMSSVGEPPSIYDPEQKEQTLEQMNKYLDYHGFFKGQAYAVVDSSKGRRISVSYHIEEGKPYIIDTIDYNIPDESLLEIVKQGKEDSYLQPGGRFDEGKFEKERLRLLKLLKNNGYFEIVKSYIVFEADTTIAPYKVAVTTIIKNKIDGSSHQSFTIGKVLFDVDVNVRGRKVAPDTIVHKGIVYVQGRKKYSKRVLDRKVFVRPDSLYSQEATEDTQRSLAALNIFKFVNVKYDTVGGVFSANIFTSPYPKYQVTAEGGFNVGQAFIPGPFMSFSFINRNMLNSADIFEVRAQFSVENQAGLTDASNQLRSLQASTNASVTLPRIVFPIPRKWKRTLAPRLPRTQFSLGYSYINRPEYVRTNLQSSMSYQWVNRKQDNFKLSLLDMGLVNTASIDSAFQGRLEELASQGNTLINSFDRSIVSSTIFEYTKVSGQYGQLGKAAGYFKAHLETGGPMVRLLSQATLSSDQTLLGLRFFEFYKVSFDKRWSIPTGSSGQVAARIHAGWANAYGGSDEALPYEKYFFSGGSSSNRAWRARRVGPGSYTPPLNDDGTFDDRFEQYGEILLEANVELRGNLFSFVDGALFVDATNIWMSQEDPNRPGAKFEARDFWKELAVGAGFGVRLDFSFLLIRFDMGIKMYDPALPEGSRFIGDNISIRQPFGSRSQQILNLGIGYPF